MYDLIAISQGFRIFSGIPETANGREKKAASSMSYPWRPGYSIIVMSRNPLMQVERKERHLSHGMGRNEAGGAIP